MYFIFQKDDIFYIHLLNTENNHLNTIFNRSLWLMYCYIIKNPLLIMVTKWSHVLSLH